LFAASFVASALRTTLACGSTLDASGRLVFDSDALLTQGFESLSGAQAQGASWLAWNTAYTALTATAVTAGDWASSSGGSGTVTLPNALEGGSALRLGAGNSVALALVDKVLFDSLKTRRVQVSFWGFSVGAEPELDVVYPSKSQPVGPDGFGRIVAVRTGRETSDGWAEYSTGPIDGEIVFANIPVGAIILTARFATRTGTFARDAFDLAPSGSDGVLDTKAYALVDAVEIEPAPGSPMPASSCTQATAATACGSLGECSFGRCIDGSLIWGAVPAAADHRADMVNRWAFIAQHLGADRKAAANAATVFSTTAVAAVAGATAAPAFYGGLNTLVSSVRDGHTSLGVSQSGDTVFFEALSSFGSYSGSLDVCFGLAEDDVSGAAGRPVYAVFWMAPMSALGSAFGGTIAPGDMLVQVDGLAPDAWLDTVEPRFAYSVPNDATAEPAARALLLARALAKYATTAAFSSCTAQGACTTKTVPVAGILDAFLTGSTFQGTSYQGATASSRRCSGRFVDSVAAWTTANDETAYDVPVVDTSGGVTAVEFDGYEGQYSATATGNYPTWTTPMDQATASGQNLLVDARLGHGGLFLLGRYLVHRIRGTASPYFGYAVPRGTWDDPDPSWLFDPSAAECADGNYDAPDFCGWSGGNSDGSTLASPPAAAVKIAWVNGNDISMNDITPRDLLGAPNVRVFGGVPTWGAYGEVSQVPPIGPGWAPGSIAVLDIRFGSNFATAIAAPWGSGTGVPPDQVVLQKVSDILAGTDTVLTTARAWLSQ
jgi:hypothetical protein